MTGGAAGFAGRGRVAAEVAACLERLGTDGERLRVAITVLDRTARQTAEVLDGDAIDGRPLGPLHGVPVAIKDNIDVAGVPCTAGSPLFVNRVPGEDAPVVERLRGAGAVVVAKTNLSELAIGPTTQNRTFGACRNPWDEQRLPGGSSGGSAVAVAGGMVRLALGTDTGGSVRLPAAATGIVGLRPSYGTVSIDGTMPVSPSFDAVGPMARTVDEIAGALGVLRDRPLPPARPLRDGQRPLAGLRVGRPTPFFSDHLDDDVATAVDAAAEVLRRLGAEVVDVPLADAGMARMRFEVLAGQEVVALHRDRLAGSPDGFDPTIRTRLEAAADVASSAVERARAWLQDWQAAVEALWDRVEVLLTPTFPGAVPLRSQAEDPAAIERFTSLLYPWSLVPGPTLSVPCGFHHAGTPIGMQLTGPVDADTLVLAVGAVYQQVTDWHLAEPLTADDAFGPSV